MSNNNSTTSGGAGFTSLLLIAFIVLKLTGVITWSWWWVLSPAWIPASIAVLLLAGWLVWKLKGTKNDAPKVVDKNGQLKTKWQERLEQMQKTKTDNPPCQ